MGGLLVKGIRGTVKGSVAAVRAFEASISSGAGTRKKKPVLGSIA